MKGAAMRSLGGGTKRHPCTSNTIGTSSTIGTGGVAGRRMGRPDGGTRVAHLLILAFTTGNIGFDSHKELPRKISEAQCMPRV